MLNMHNGRRFIYSSVVLVGVPILLSGCSALKRSAGSIRDELKSKDETESSVAHEGTLNDLKSMQAQVSTPSQLYDEEDIVWASEDPEEEMAELEALWESGPQDDWFESYTEALKEARKEGKPVLMWFTDSKSNVSTQALSNELFSLPGFSKWAHENVIRLRIDSYVRDSDSDRLERKRDYVNDLKERYKVLGAPVVFILSPRGSVFGKYTGYKTGSSVFYFGRLKNAHRNAVVDYGKWRSDLEDKGYRVWHDHRGRKVFAKPSRLSKGTLHLVAPDGARSKTALSKLSAEDRAWVKKQQAEKARQRR